VTPRRVLPPPGRRSQPSMKRVRLGGGAGEAVRCLSEQSAEQAAAAASLLYDMKGCYSRLQALVPTLPRHRRVSKVEILQHVIDYIWDLQLELQHPPARGQPLGGGPDGERSGAGSPPVRGWSAGRVCPWE
uniref:DNA-binding protein inhibitor ID-4 n=1 Tax=Pelusios castaneus TaxID=367368 RepID=A0A8C8R504_9SAUR